MGQIGGTALGSTGAILWYNYHEKLIELNKQKRQRIIQENLELDEFPNTLLNTFPDTPQEAQKRLHLVWRKRFAQAATITGVLLALSASFFKNKNLPDGENTKKDDNKPSNPNNSNLPNNTNNTNVINSKPSTNNKNNISQKRERDKKSNKINGCYMTDKDYSQAFSYPNFDSFWKEYNSLEAIMNKKPLIRAIKIVNNNHIKTLAKNTNLLKSIHYIAFRNIRNPSKQLLSDITNLVTEIKKNRPANWKLKYTDLQYNNLSKITIEKLIPIFNELPEDWGVIIRNNGLSKEEKYQIVEKLPKAKITRFLLWEL